MLYQAAKNELQSQPPRLCVFAMLCEAGGIAFVALLLTWLI